MTASMFAIFLYTTAALIFTEATYREGLEGDNRWDGPRVLGLAMCSLWPLLMVCVIVLSYTSRRAR